MTAISNFLRVDDVGGQSPRFCILTALQFELPHCGGALVVSGHLFQKQGGCVRTRGHGEVPKPCAGHGTGSGSNATDGEKGEAGAVNREGTSIQRAENLTSGVEQTPIRSG